MPDSPQHLARRLFLVGVDDNAGVFLPVSESYKVPVVCQENAPVLGAVFEEFRVVIALRVVLRCVYNVVPLGAERVYDSTRNVFVGTRSIYLSARSGDSDFSFSSFSNSRCLRRISSTLSGCL